MLIDIVFVIIMVLAIIKGISRGLIVALFSFIALFIGLAAALKLSSVFAVYLQDNTGIEGKWLPILSFFIVFIGAVILVRWLAMLLKKTVSMVLLGWLDRLGGMLLYALLYLMIYSVVLFYATQIHLISKETTVDSATYEYILPWAPFVIDGLGKIIPFFSNVFADLTRFFSGLGPTVNKI